MRKKSLLVLLAIATFAAAVVVGMGASAAFAGEVTGNCNNAPAGSPAADNCKEDQNANANSICAFSGQNDNPDAPLDQAVPPGPGGPSQSYGQENRLGLRDPSADNPGQGDSDFFPGNACNGNSGFLSGP
jgi:hypothetical protein